MAVTSISILTLPDGVNYPEQINLRPEMKVAWVGGTGPFNVVHEWDTDSGFGSPITDTNNGVTSPNIGVPPSDMGGNVTWYYRVTIEDTFDTTFLTEPAAGLWEINFFDDTNTAFYKWYLHLYDNIVPGFDAGEVDDAKEALRYLYLYKNITMDTPCPFLSNISPTLVGIGDTVTLTGSGFGALQSTFGTEIRLFDAPNFAASYILLTPTFWSDTLVTVTVPTGATSGWVAVVQTAGGSISVISSAHTQDTSSITKPPTGADGDSILIFTMAANDTDLAAPSGYTKDFTFGTSSEDDRRVQVYRKGPIANWAAETMPSLAAAVDHCVAVAMRNLDVSPFVGGTGTFDDNVDPGQPEDFLILGTAGSATDINFIMGYTPSADTTPSWVTTNPTFLPDPQFSHTGSGRIGHRILTVGGTTNTAAIAPSGNPQNNDWIGCQVVYSGGGAGGCPGSAFKRLTIEIAEADPEAGWWAEFTDFKNVAVTPFSNPGMQPQVAAAQISPVMNAIGNGRIDLPLADPTIPEIIDPATDTGSFIRIFIDQVYRYGFYTENLELGVDDNGGAIVSISGDGLEKLSKRAIVRPFDYPANPSKLPTWIYGSTGNLIRNPGFEDDLPVLENPGGEDGNNDSGGVLGWTGFGSGFISATAIEDGLEAFEDDWYIEVDTSSRHSGIKQSVTVTPGKVYHIQARVQGTSTGQRITLAVGGGATATGTFPNNFSFGGEIIAELDNVPRNPSGNGCPGGDTDGTWQVLDVEVLTNSGTTSLTIKIQDDHHSGCSPSIHDPFWVDSVTIEGWGLGLQPWIAFDAPSHASNSFRIDSTGQIPGSMHSCLINPTGDFAGIEQTDIAVLPNAKYSLSCTGKTASVIAGDAWKLEANKTDGTILGFDEVTPVANTPTQFSVTFTVPAGIEEIHVRFVYSGTNNPASFFVDNFALVEGEPPATPGKIILDIMAPIQARGTVDFLDLTSFTEILDSKGNAWFGLVAMDIEPGASLYDVLNRLVALGYEWEIVPIDFAAGGFSGAQLNLYNSRSFGSGIGQDQTIDEKTGLLIEAGRHSVSGGSIQKRAFTKNTIFAIDQEGNWSIAETSDIVDDLLAFGRIEGHLNTSAGDLDTIADYAAQAISDEEDKAFAVKYDFTRDDFLRPFLHFKVGDSVFVDPTPQGDRITRRVRGITADLLGEGTDIQYTTDLSRVFFKDEAAVLAALNQLLERAPSDLSGVGTGTVTTSSTGFVQTVVVSETAAPHNHSLASAEITAKTVSGDISGALPGPINVIGLQGDALSGEQPTGQNIWVWNAEADLWEPVPVPIANTLMMLGGS